MRPEEKQATTVFSLASSGVRAAAAATLAAEGSAAAADAVAPDGVAVATGWAGAPEGGGVFPVAVVIVIYPLFAAAFALALDAAATHGGSLTSIECSRSSSEACCM